MHDIKDGDNFEILEKANMLMEKIVEGRESGEKEGYISFENLREHINNW